MKINLQRKKEFVIKNLRTMTSRGSSSKDLGDVEPIDEEKGEEEGSVSQTSTASTRPKSLCIRICRFMIHPCACLCASLSDLAAKLSVVASLAAAAAVGLAVGGKADIALGAAAVSSTGATIAAVLAVCGSCCTAFFDMVTKDEEEEEDEDDYESQSGQDSKRFNTSQADLRGSTIPEDEEIDVQPMDSNRSFDKNSKQVSWKEGGGEIKA